MFLLRLTTDNCQFLKRQLREIYPHIGSSHLTEALAAGYGWNTHAAFRTAAATFPLGREPAVRFDAAALRVRLDQLGAPPVDEERIAGAVHGLPHPCWMEFSQRKHPAEDSWFYACERASVPFIYVRVARKYALLQWDCISIDPSYEAGVRDAAGSVIMRSLFACFQKQTKGASGRPFFEGSAFVGTVENLLPATARILADVFFETLYGATRTAIDPVLESA